MTLPATRPGAEVSRWHRAGNRRLAGLLGVVFGSGWFLQETRFFGWAPGWDLVLSGVLVALGAGLLATARAPRRIWPFLLGGLLVLSLSGDDVTFPSMRAASMGDATYRISDSAELRGEYERFAGDLALDLRELVLPTEGRIVRVKLGAGDVIVDVPRRYRVVVQATVGAGSVNSFGAERAAGVAIKERISIDPGERIDELAFLGERAVPVLRLDIQIGAGELVIR